MSKSKIKNRNHELGSAQEDLSFHAEIPSKKFFPTTSLAAKKAKSWKRAKMAKKASLAIVKTITRARELMRKSQHMMNLINKRDKFSGSNYASC